MDRMRSGGRTRLRTLGRRVERKELPARHGEETGVQDEREVTPRSRM